MCNAEALFLVDYAKTEILENNVLLQNSVGSDDNVDFAAAKACKNLFLLFRSSETGKKLNGNGKTVHSLEECLVMLPRKNGGRNKNGNLLSVHNRFESGAESNFGFAEANVAAKKAVHGSCHFHIVLDFLYAAELVVRFLVRESFLKIPLPIVVFGKSIALGSHSL